MIGASVAKLIVLWLKENDKETDSGSLNVVPVRLPPTIQDLDFSSSSPICLTHETRPWPRSMKVLETSLRATLG